MAATTINNWNEAIDHRYRLRNGKVALITGIVLGADGSQLKGVIVGEGEILHWDDQGKARNGNTNLDLMECISGPNISR